MSRPLLGIALLVFGAYAAAYPPPAKDTKPDADKLARELGEEFLTQAEKRGYDAILKRVEFPYKSVGGKPYDKPEPVRQELRDLISALWTDETKVSVKEVVAADKFEEWAAALPLKPEVYKTEAARKGLLEHLGKDGRVVALQFEIEGKKDDDLALLLVRVKDGKAAIIGLVD